MSRLICDFLVYFPALFSKREIIASKWSKYYPFRLHHFSENCNLFSSILNVYSFIDIHFPGIDCKPREPLCEPNFYVFLYLE